MSLLSFSWSLRSMSGRFSVFIVFYWAMTSSSKREVSSLLMAFRREYRPIKFINQYTHKERRVSPKDMPKRAPGYFGVSSLLDCWLGEAKATVIRIMKKAKDMRQNIIEAAAGIHKWKW